MDDDEAPSAGMLDVLRAPSPPPTPTSSAALAGAIHMPSHIVPESERVRAAAGAFIAHFVWLLRGIEGAAPRSPPAKRGSPLPASMDVPEDYPPGEVVMFRAGTHAFDAIAAIMAGAR